ncbi:MAG: hypothetical protein QM741_05510 [Rudaea sp.]
MNEIAFAIQLLVESANRSENSKSNEQELDSRLRGNDEGRFKFEVQHQRA